MRHKRILGRSGENRPTFKNSNLPDEEQNQKQAESKVKSTASVKTLYEFAEQNHGSKMPLGITARKIRMIFDLGKQLRRAPGKALHILAHVYMNCKWGERLILKKEARNLRNSFQTTGKAGKRCQTKPHKT